MTWIYEALEIYDRRGKPQGKYRVVRWEYSQPNHLQGLCDHMHGSVEDALRCPTVTRILDNEFSEHPRLPRQLTI